MPIPEIFLGNRDGKKMGRRISSSRGRNFLFGLCCGFFFAFFILLLPPLPIFLNIVNKGVWKAFTRCSSHRQVRKSLLRYLFLFQNSTPVNGLGGVEGILCVFGGFGGFCGGGRGCGKMVLGKTVFQFAPGVGGVYLGILRGGDGFWRMERVLREGGELG